MVKVGDVGHYYTRSHHLEVEGHDPVPRAIAGRTELVDDAGEPAVTTCSVCDEPLEGHPARIETLVADRHRCTKARIIELETCEVAAYDPEADAAAAAAARAVLASPEVRADVESDPKTWQPIAAKAQVALREIALRRLDPPRPTIERTGLVTLEVADPDYPDPLIRPGVIVGGDPADGNARFHVLADHPKG